MQSVVVNASDSEKVLVPVSEESDGVVIIEIPESVVGELGEEFTEESSLNLREKICEWLNDKGVNDSRPERWKRYALIVGGCTMSVIIHIYAEDPQIIVASGAFSATQVYAEMYDWPLKAQGVFLAAITGLSWAGQEYLFPNSTYLSKAALPASCLALAYRTLTLQTQKWMNINSARNT